MKFTIPALAMLALTSGVCAKKHKESKTSEVVAAETGPVTIENPAAAQSSVLSVMSAQSPSATPTTTSTSKGHKHEKTKTSTKKHRATKKHSSVTSVTEVNVAPSTFATVVKSSSVESSAEAEPTEAANATRTTDLERRGLSIAGIFTNLPLPTSVCQAMATYGYDYVPTLSTAAGFLADATLNATALTAITPAGFTWNYAGFYTAMQASSYITYAQLSSYSPSTCAAFCNATTGCNGFDIYFERDPTVLPGVGCTNPSVQTSIHCALYSTALNYTAATNVGQWNSAFEVIVTGANGYSRIGASTASTTTSSSSSSSSSAAASASSAANPFTIVSAYFGNVNITALAQANFLVNGGLTINTAFPSAAGLGLVNPFGSSSATSQTVSILYTWGTETRIFTALENSGTYAQGANTYTLASCPGAALAPTNPPTSLTAKYTIVGATYGGVQVSSTYLSSMYTWFGNSLLSLTSILIGSSVTTSDNTLVMYYKSTGSNTISTSAVNQNSFFITI